MKISDKMINHLGLADHFRNLEIPEEFEELAKKYVMTMFQVRELEEHLIAAVMERMPQKPKPKKKRRIESEWDNQERQLLSFIEESGSICQSSADAGVDEEEREIPKL